MRNILNENFTNGWYAERGLELQNLVKSDVQNDPNTPYNYNDFIANLNTDVNTGGGGPGGPRRESSISTQGTSNNTHTTSIRRCNRL